MGAYFNTIFELIKYKNTKEKALKIAENLNHFFRSGIDDLIKRAKKL